MLYYFLVPLADKFQPFNVFRYITFRTGGAIMTALIIAFVLGPPLIQWLKVRQGKGQPIREDGPQRHLLGGSTRRSQERVAIGRRRFHVPDGDHAVSAGASVTLALRFSPVATGPHAAAVLIDSDDPVRPQQGFDVRGVGAAAGGTAIATIPRRMRFGATLVGRTRDLPFVVENRSRVGIIVTNVDMFTPVPGLTIDAAPARPFALAPGASQSVLLHYAPTVVAAAGFREQLILETTDAGGLQPRTAFVTVVGSAHSVGTDLLTSLLAAIGLAEEPDEVLV